jgi:hypothetical protein
VQAKTVTIKSLTLRPVISPIISQSPRTFGYCQKGINKRRIITGVNGPRPLAAIRSGISATSRKAWARF